MKTKLQILLKYQIMDIAKVDKIHVKYVNWGSRFNFGLLTSLGEIKNKDFLSVFFWSFQLHL